MSTRTALRARCGSSRTPVPSRAAASLIRDPRWTITDPWVFGETFRYSNCKQLIYRQNPSALQRLTAGSVILFGSTLYGEFVLDTVFVVKKPVPYVPHHPPETDEAFRLSTIESIITDGRGDLQFTLYHGATFDEPVAGMFSFVPCRGAADTDACFARPVVSLPGYARYRTMFPSSPYAHPATHPSPTMRSR